MIILCCLLLFRSEETCPPIREKPKLAVFEFQGIGVEKKNLTTIVSDLLRDELSKCPNYRVISKEVMIVVLGDTLTVKDIDDVKTKSDTLKAKLAVIGRITQLGTKTILSVSLINVRNKVTIFTDKLTSSNIDDLEIVIPRLAKALCKMEKAKSNVTVETVTEEEAKPKRRRSSYFTGGMLLGYFFPLGDEKKMYFNSVYLYEMPYYMVEATLDFFSLFPLPRYVTFCIYRFLNLEDFSPFIGGGVGTEEYETEEYKYAHHFLIKGGIGFVAFRTFDFHFILNVRYKFIFTEELKHGIMLNFGLTWREKERKGCCTF
jgi:TolB-like protein